MVKQLSRGLRDRLRDLIFRGVESLAERWLAGPRRILFYIIPTIKPCACLSLSPRCSGNLADPPSVKMSSVGNLPPATPAFVLRGHAAPVHTLQFYKRNAFLVSGDSEGWIVVWSVTSKRSVACWRAHEGSILGIKAWGNSVIT